MDRLAAFLLALAAAVAAIGAAAWCLRDVVAVSFETPPAPAPPDARAVALVPLEWFEEREETRSSPAGPSPLRAQVPSFPPWSPPARPESARLARSAAAVRQAHGGVLSTSKDAGTYRAQATPWPPPDEFAQAPAPEPRDASARPLPRLAPAERHEVPDPRPSPSVPGPTPPPPRLSPGPLELQRVLAEELAP